MIKDGFPSGQRGQTVNLLAFAFGGSNPSPSIDKDSSAWQASYLRAWCSGSTTAFQAVCVGSTPIARLSLVRRFNRVCFGPGVTGMVDIDCYPDGWLAQAYRLLYRGRSVRMAIRLLLIVHMGVSVGKMVLMCCSDDLSALSSACLVRVVRADDLVIDRPLVGFIIADCGRMPM